jgi:hypothetical protein
MTAPTLRHVGLGLREEEPVPLPRIPEGECRHTTLAAVLRGLFTPPGGTLQARAGAVFLDEDGHPRVLTAPFAGGWPRAEPQALELFATASKLGCPGLVLFRTEPNPQARPELMALQVALDMRALGMLFAIEVVDLLIVRPKRHWSLSKVPVLGASLDCEATLNRTFNYLIACGFERSLPALPIGASTEAGVSLRVEHLLQGSCVERLFEGPWPVERAEPRLEGE